MKSLLIQGGFSLFMDFLVGYSFFRLHGRKSDLKSERRGHHIVQRGMDKP